MTGRIHRDRLLGELYHLKSNGKRVTLGKMPLKYDIDLIGSADRHIIVMNSGVCGSTMGMCNICSRVVLSPADYARAGWTMRASHLNFMPDRRCGECTRTSWVETLRVMNTMRLEYSVLYASVSDEPQLFPF